MVYSWVLPISIIIIIIIISYASTNFPDVFPLLWGLKSQLFMVSSQFLIGQMGVNLPNSPFCR